MQAQAIARIHLGPQAIKRRRVTAVTSTCSAAVRHMHGRRVLASCGVKVTRLRSTLTALLVWFVLVSLVRALAITVFEVITDFNAEAGNPENGKV